MNAGERLRRYRERQLELLAAYAELQGKIGESARAGQAEQVAAQAGEAHRLAQECGELERAARRLGGAGRAAAGGPESRLESRLEEARQTALEAGRRARAALEAACGELSAALRSLASRPRTPPSPFARIAQPRLIDIRS